MRLYFSYEQLAQIPWPLGADPFFRGVPAPWSSDFKSDPLLSVKHCAVISGIIRNLRGVTDFPHEKERFPPASGGGPRGLRAQG